MSEKSSIFPSKIGSIHAYLFVNLRIRDELSKLRFKRAILLEKKHLLFACTCTRQLKLATKLQKSKQSRLQASQNLGSQASSKIRRSDSTLPKGLVGFLPRRRGTRRESRSALS